jgi:hypothetical protein
MKLIEWLGYITVNAIPGLRLISQVYAKVTGKELPISFDKPKSLEDEVRAREQGKVGGMETLIRQGNLDAAVADENRPDFWTKQEAGRWALEKRKLLVKNREVRLHPSDVASGFATEAELVADNKARDAQNAAKGVDASGQELMSTPWGGPQQAAPVPEEKPKTWVDMKRGLPVEFASRAVPPPPLPVANTTHVTVTNNISGEGMSPEAVGRAITDSLQTVIGQANMSINPEVQ